MEVETLIIISKNLNYINEDSFKKLSEQLEEVSKILQGLIKGVQQKINITENSN
jgi:four helix bundle protein